MVRMCDTVAYVGQDIEDAVRMGILDTGSIPGEVVETLGNTNSRIINSLVSDIADSSLDGDTIRLSPRVAASFRRLREFNTEKIYNHPEIRRERERIHHAFRILFDVGPNVPNVGSRRYLSDFLMAHERAAGFQPWEVRNP